MSVFAKRGTHRFALEQWVSADGSERREQWVVIRDELTYYQKQEMSGAMFASELVDGVLQQKTDVSRLNPSILEAYVTDWQVYEDDGEEVAFSIEMLADLEENVAKSIIAHINERAMTLDSEKKRQATSPNGTTTLQS